MRINILFGGAAGQGPNILTNVLGEALVGMGYNVFYSRDYQSLIRGGHNFNVLTFSDEEVYSNDSKIDIIVALDEKTEDTHKKDLNKKGIIVENEEEENMYFAGRVFKILGIDFEVLEKQLKKLEKRYEENIVEAKKGYNSEKRSFDGIKIKHIGENNKVFENGNKGIAEGAIKSGLDVYYAYPMTPATSVLNELAERQDKDNFLVLELENEIAVINAAIGSAITGAKSMTGTSGGGFDLMTEALSMAGIAEIPMVVYLSQRPGPGTGVATYTGQGDLNLARHFGHGEFKRVILAPGDPKESQELTSECFYFSQKYKIPCILMGDKHLAESFFTTNNKPKITKSEKSTKLIRYNSYEKDENGSATENPEIIMKNIEHRKKTFEELKKDAEKNFGMFELYGKKESKNTIVSWGSTKGAILDSINGLDVKFLQVKYLEPFSEKIKEILSKSEKVILVENNSTGSLADLIAEKTGIIINEKEKILRYDGRPFFADELRKEIVNKISGRLK
jgi:2-oxoglutarate ferredoxin oxidoreductase subunit alpha